MPDDATAAAPAAAAAALTARPPDEVLYWRDGGAAVSVGRFLAEVAALAARLPEAPHVLNLCADRYHALLAFAAALTRGQVTLLSADRTPYRLRELAERHPGLYAIADAPDESGRAEEPALLVPVFRCAAAALSSGGTGDLAAAAAPPPLIPRARIAAIAFTSGSTGTPTQHAKPWGSLIATAEAAAERFGLDARRGAATIVATVPPQHMYGFETTIVLPLHSAAAAYAGPTFYPSDVAEALARVPPGRRVLVTTPLHLRAQLASGAAMPALTAVISATAPLARDLAEQAERAWATRVLEIYGATEAGSLASRRTLDGAEWLPYRGIRIRAEPAAAAAEVPGLPGPVPLADALEPAGEDGRFRLLGRRADLVKLAGKRASLAGLNRILNGIDGVADGVFLAPEDLDSNPRARLAAFVVAPDRSPEEILQALRERVEAERARFRRTLESALDSMSEGFVMFDAEDQLAVCNSRYKEFYRISAPFIRPGARFEDIIREGARRGQYPQAGEDIEAFTTRLTEWHRGDNPPMERLLPDGRWVLITERRTADGGTVTAETVEFRLPDGSAVPHFLLAGIVQAARAANSFTDRSKLLDSLRADAKDTVASKSIPRGFAEIAELLEQERAVFEANDVFSPVLIDAEIARLKSAG